VSLRQKFLGARIDAGHTGDLPPQGPSSGRLDPPSHHLGSGVCDPGSKGGPSPRVEEVTGRKNCFSLEVTDPVRQKLPTTQCKWQPNFQGLGLSVVLIFHGYHHKSSPVRELGTTGTYSLRDFGRPEV
jgi:hypothetical protein